MRIIGLDYGEARIGVAVSDILGTIANPLDTICEKDLEKQLEKVMAVVEKERAEKI
ncbi:MAG: RuvX/YqgF family protein, partial [Clostridia bacterium]|nr:RuvX/YqgF family protein [Clostridia bacterium]